MSKISLAPDASGTGIFTIASPGTSTNRTLTLPDDTGTIVTNSGNQAGSFTTLNTSGAVVFNDAGADVDFRVEGDTDANLLFVDAGNNRVGIGTSTPTYKLDVEASADGGSFVAEIVNTNSANDGRGILNLVGNSSGAVSTLVFAGGRYFGTDNDTLAVINNAAAGGISFCVGGVANSTRNEKARITSDGAFLIGKTTTGITTAGVEFRQTLAPIFTQNGQECLFINRGTNDGTLIDFRQDNTPEGSISVSGSTVSYNGGHLSRWAQLTTPKDDTPLFKGTVMSNLDEMNVYIAPTTYWTEEDELPEGVNVGDVKEAEHEVENEQLNKVKVSDVEGDANVAGVFVNWEYDKAHQVDEINMAMTGDMIIRIGEGVTVARGDLLMSAGDGTAMPQGDDIVRSKTVAKVTSTHVTCTYDDGSYCVPCVLMAC
jgi:hypothetical protein